MALRNAPEIALFPSLVSSLQLFSTSAIEAFCAQIFAFQVGPTFYAPRLQRPIDVSWLLRIIRGVPLIWSCSPSACGCPVLLCESDYLLLFSVLQCLLSAVGPFSCDRSRSTRVFSNGSMPISTYSVFLSSSFVHPNS